MAANVRYLRNSVNEELKEIIELAHRYGAASPELMSAWYQQWKDLFLSEEVARQYFGNKHALEKIEETLHKMKGLIQTSQVIGSRGAINREFTAVYVRNVVYPETARFVSLRDGVKHELEKVVGMAKRDLATPSAVIDEWAREWKETFFPEHVLYKYFGNEKALDKLEAALQRMQGVIQTTGRIGSANSINKEFTAEHIEDVISRSTQHSFSKRARVIGRYAALTGIETGRLSDEGGYYLARY